MMFNVYCCMDKGLRKYQQDCIYLDGEIVQREKECGRREYNKERLLFAVCDGMGGLSHGDKASKFVCETLKKVKIDFSKEDIEKALRQIQDEFIRKGFLNSGTTIAGIFINGNKSFIFNAGDSRVYKLNKEGIWYISHDHSYVQTLVDMGLIYYEEAFYHPYRNLIEFGIGDVFQEEWEKGRKPFVKEDIPREGDIYHGVHDVLKDREIFSLLMPFSEKSLTLFLKVLEERKSDNYSSIIIQPLF